MRPDLLKINPATNQRYTPEELAKIDLENRIKEIQGAGFGAFQSLQAGSVKEVVPDATNDYFNYSDFGFVVGDNNEETRAQLQPWYEQLRNSVGKMATTAGATFLDGTVGTVMGLVNVVGGEKNQDLYNRFINNPFSQGIVDFQENMERVLPNYMTKEEQEAAWYENAVFNPANFWGETIIKNMGFAIGALTAGVVTGAAGESLLGINRLRKTSNILKGLTSKIQEGAALTETEASLLKTLSSTELASVKGQQVIKELDEWAKKISSRTTMNQAVSSLMGAAAEARIEALQGGREFARQYEEKLQESLALGEITAEQYQARMKNLDKELSNYQNSVFSGNLALLSISNFNQFKNVFSKGFTPNKIVKDAVEGDIIEGYAVKELSKTKRIAQLLKNPLWEMTEEQGQFAIQKGMDSYYTLKADSEANATVKNAIFSIGQGLKEAYGSAEGWENAFAGLVIGGLGIPMIGKKDSGRYGLKLAGGIAETYREQQESRNKLGASVNAANDLIKDSMMSKLYESATVDAALQKRFNAAIDEDDRMNGKLISSQQLTNIVNTMIDIGKYDDFIKLLDDETKLSAAEIREKYKHKKQSLVKGKELEDVDFFQNMTDEQVEKYIKDKSATAKTRANALKTIKDNIAVRFGHYKDDAKKDMLFLAAGALEVDERIPELGAFLKQKFLERGGKFLNDPNLKTNENITLFSALTTPEEFEEFLLQRDGYEKYQSIIDAYLRVETDPKIAIQFAEKARDLFSLVAKRQEFNDEYFRMATDESYISNKEASIKSQSDSERLGLKATDEFRAELYKNHTNDDPEYGFESDEFHVKLDEEEVVDIEYENAAGEKEIYKNVKAVLGPDGKPVQRVDSKGNTYNDYTAIDNSGKEVSLKNLKNVKETTRKETPEVILSYKKGDPNVLIDQDGNEYDLTDLAQDPAFLDPATTTIVTRSEIRQQIIDQARKESLSKMMQVNQTLINNLEEEIKDINESIELTEKLLQRARANKTGKTSYKVNGVTTVFTVFALEKLLEDHKAKKADLEANFQEQKEEAFRIAMQAEQAKKGGFKRDSFDKDLEAVGKQIAYAQQLLNQYEANNKKLSKVITSLKNLIKVIYPKFKKLYMDIYGVDPSTVEEIIKRWQTDVTPILRKLRAEEISRYENITAKEQELAELQDDIAALKKFIEESKDLVEKINIDKAYFEAEFKKIVAERRLAKAASISKAANSSKQKADAKLEIELGENQNKKIEEFKSAKRSYKNTGITAGRDFIDDATVNPRPASQRWYRTASKVNLNNGSFSLRIVSVNERPDLFEDVPDDLKEDALACILYNKDKPVDSNLQPLDENAPENKLVYTFIEKPVTSQSQLNERFYDAAKDPYAAAAMQQALDATRKAMQEKLASGKPVFVPITDKSSGILRTTGARRTPGNDGTVAIWSALLGNGTDADKMEAYNQGSIQVGVAANEQDAIDGVAYITAGGKEVKVRNGLVYFVTKDAEVIPLLSRKLSTSEVELVLDLLETKARGIHELATSEEDAEALAKEAAATPKAKKEDKKKKKKAGGKKVRVFVPNKYGKSFNPKTRKRGFWVYRTVKKQESKKGAKKETPLAAVEKVDILKYISEIIYFGRQTKPDGSLISSDPNPQTEIFLSDKDAQTGLYTTLTFYDFNKKEAVTIPFTAEGLAENREALALFLANKYHQVRKSKLTGTNKRGKDFKHTQVKNVVFDENNNPLYLETESFINYEAYLLNDKKGERSIDEIPLTTNAAPDPSTGNVVVKSVYFTFPLSPSQITETPPKPKAGKAAVAKTPKTNNTRVDNAKNLLNEILNYINNPDNFKLDKDAKDKSLDIILNLSKKFEKSDKVLYNAFEKFKTENLEFFKDNETVQSLSFSEDEDALLAKKEVAAKNLYEEALFIQKILEDFINEAAETEAETIVVATATEEDEDEGVEVTEEEAAVSPIIGLTSTESEDDADEFDSEAGFSGTDKDKKEDDDDGVPFRTQKTGGPLINIEEARANVKRMLPKLDVRISEKIANGIAQGSIDLNGVIHLSNFAEEGTEYHEALHGVMLGILTDEELKDVYKEAKKLYGEPTEAELAHWKTIYPKASKQVLTRIFYDEKLAEDFRTYALTDGKVYPSPKIKGFFERILDFIKAFFGKKGPNNIVTDSLIDSNPIYSMFKNLYNGQYADREFDSLKAKQRIGEGINELFRPLPVPNTNPVDRGVITKEIINAVVHKMFKLVRSSSSTAEEFSKALEGEGLNIVIDQSINSVINDIKTLKDPVAKERAETILLPLLTRDLNLKNKEGKSIALRNVKTGDFFRDTYVYKAIREYLENDLGIKTGLYTEENLAEDQQEDTQDESEKGRDTPWTRDVTTVSPREGVNSFIKLMLSGIQDYERDASGELIKKVGDYGLPTLVNPNLLYNHLLQLLSKATSYPEMIDILKQNVINQEKGLPKFPYLQDVIDFLEDPHTLQKSPSSAFMLKLNFQQAMNKAMVDYKFWLVNEQDVKQVDPTSDNLHDRISDQWRNNIISSLNTKGSPIVKKNDKIVFNPTALKQIEKDAASKYKPESFDYYVEVLDNIGFTITAPGEFNSKERDVILENAKFLIASLPNKDINFIFNPSAKGSASGRINALAILESVRNIEKTDFQHIGPDGKTRYGIIQHNMISTISQVINNMPIGTNRTVLFNTFPFLDSVYSQNSHLLNDVLFRYDSTSKTYKRTAAPFKISLLEGGRVNTPGAEGQSNTDMVKADRAWISFNSILKGVAPILRTSDKSNEFGLNTGAPFYTLENYSDVDSYLNIFMGYLEDELNASLVSDADAIQYFRKNIEKSYGGTYFFADILKEANIRPILPRDPKTNKPLETVKQYIKSNEAAIKSAILRFLEQHDQEVIRYLQQAKIVESSVTASGKNVHKINALDISILEQFNKKSPKLQSEEFKALIRTFSLNSLISNIEQTKLLFGHPAFYKDIVDLYKRTAGAVGTKLPALVDNHVNAYLQGLDLHVKDGKAIKDGTLETLVLEEPITDSIGYNLIRTKFEKEGFSNAKELASKYLNFKEGDGQGYITLPEYREFMIRLGQLWSPSMEATYKRLMDGEAISPDALKVFNPLKAQHYGLVKIGEISVPVYLKFSLLPLIPAIYKGTKLENLAESMMAKGKGIAVYPTGIKTGALMQDTNGNFIEIYNAEGEGLAIPKELNSLELDYKFMGIQVNTGSTIKQETTRGSQQAKLVLANLFNRGEAKPITIFEEIEVEVTDTVKPTPQKGFKLSIDKKGKDQGKANLANAFIAYPNKGTSSYQYLKDAENQGIPVNTDIKAGPGVVAFVSVNGNNKATKTQLDSTIEQAKRIIAAGGTVVMDNPFAAVTSWNESGEGVVQLALGSSSGLTSEGYNYWGPNPEIVEQLRSLSVAPAQPTASTTSITPTIDLTREWESDLESRPVYTKEGVNTMRTSNAKPNEHFGNPFSAAGYGGTIKVASIADAVAAYKEWLLGTKFTDVKPEQRAWILNQINQGKLDGATLLYAGKLAARGQGMHPTALVEVVESKIIPTVTQTSLTPKKLTRKKLTSQETVGLVKKYHSTINKITAYKANKLLSEIGAIDNKDGTFTITSYEKLAKILQSAARNRNSPDNLLEALTTIKSKEGTVRFKYLIDAVPGRNKIENILFSIVKNDVLVQKYFGGSRIQAAGTLFERKSRDFSPDSGNLLSNPDLKFYREGKYGETLPAQVKLAPNNEQIAMINRIGGVKDAKNKYDFDQNLIIVNNLIKKYLDNDESRYMKEAALAEGLDLEALKFVAYRIPTQGVNTIEHMEIIEFLHPISGEAIMLPSEIVVKSGGDYDIDKLNVYFKYLDKNTNRVIENTSDIKGLHNELIKLNQMFLSAPEHFTELTIPNEPMTLKSLATYMEEKYPSTKLTSTKALTWLYTLEVAENYLVGKAAVGIVARHITHHTLAQQANLTLNKVFQGRTEMLPTKLYFKGMDDKYDLASEYDVNGDKKINHIISEFLSAFVDIGKDPFVVTLNGSTKTADMYMYLLRRGVPIKTVTYFMNQPVIREYFKVVFNNQAIFKEGKKTSDGKRMVLSSSQIRKNLEEILNKAYKKASNNNAAEITNISEDLFSESQLNASLGKSLTEETDIDFIRTQANVLKYFFGYMEQADQLRMLMDATSQDTRTHKNFNSLDNTKALKVKVAKGNMFTKDSRENLIKGTLLEGFSKAQELPNVFRDLFITEDNPVKAELDKLRSYLFLNNVNLEDVNTIMDRYKNDLIVYMVSNFLKSTSPKNAKTLLELFRGDNTLAKKIAKYQRNPNKVVRNNPFLKALLPLLERANAKVEGIKMTSTQKSTFDFNQIVNGFTGIYSSKGEQASKAYQQELGLFALLQSGLDNSPITWYDKVPVDIAASIIELGINNYKSIEDKSKFLQIFTHQFFRNSLALSSLVPWVGTYSTDKTESGVEISSSGVVTLSDYHQNLYKERLYLKITAILPEYVGNPEKREAAKASDIPTTESLLLIRIADGKYQLASKLGEGMYMKEYNPELRQSYLPENNIDTGKFKNEFKTWSEPVVPSLPLDNGYTAYQDACL